MADTILFIGCGNMGRALVKGLGQDNWHKKFRFLLYDLVPERSQSLAEELGVEQVVTPEGLSPRFVFLAVKPKDVAGLANIISNFGDATFISVVAGISLQQWQEFLFPEVKVVRLMPNLCVEVGEGVVPFCFSDTVPQSEREELLFLLSSLGWIFETPEENFDCLTALSGSGPGLIAMFIEAMMDGGVAMGLPWEVSLKVALQTVLGTVVLLKTRGLHPAHFKNLVASPGGTTIAGIKAFEERGFRGMVMEGFEKAYERLVKLFSKTG
ncbi:MAG: pyrroline-5-carboxylate reductase [Candidatus Caldatribacteriaceae bacterium]